MRALATCAAAVLLGAPSLAAATTYDVGPTYAYTAIGAVPWESLAAGDTVQIHAKPAQEPYAEKWVICAQGTAAKPIRVVGVPDGAGNLPVITGENATTRTALRFTNEVRALLKIGTASTPSCDVPAFVEVEGLDLRRARSAYTFTSAAGTVTAYAQNAAAIWVETGHDITVRGCVIEDSGNGLFSSWQVQNLLVEGNLIQGNGNVGSIYEHNTYTAAAGITYRGNQFGPLCAGCGGNNLKDRSAGTVIQANWIEGGNRQLDLVDGEDDPSIPADPRYQDTWVAGNVLFEDGNDGNSQIVHFGGDSGSTGIYRTRLWFWNNTVVSTRTGNTTLFQLSTNAQQAYVFGNVFWASAGGPYLAWADADAQVTQVQVTSGSNWLPAGAVLTHGSLTGTIADAGENLAGLAPGFVDATAADFRLAAGSPCLDAAGTLPAATFAHPLDAVYVPDRQTEARAGEVPRDLGAFWRGKPGPVPGALPGGGCGCGAGGDGAFAVLLVTLAAFRRRRPFSLGEIRGRRV